MVFAGRNALKICSMTTIPHSSTRYYAYDMRIKSVGREHPHPCVNFMAQIAPPDWCVIVHQRCGPRVDSLPHPMKAACERHGARSGIVRTSLTGAYQTCELHCASATQGRQNSGQRSDKVGLRNNADQLLRFIDNQDFMPATIGKRADQRSYSCIFTGQKRPG